VILEWSDVGALRENDYYVVRMPFKGGTAEFWRKTTFVKLPGNFSEERYKLQGRRYGWTVQVESCTENCDKIQDDDVKKEGTALSGRSAEAWFIWNP
jgi:hypothetical protein